MRSRARIVSIMVGLALLSGCVSPPTGELPPTPTPAATQTPTQTPVPTVVPTPTVVPSPTPISAAIKQEVYQVLLRGSLLENDGRHEEAATLYTEGLLLAPDSVFLRIRACDSLRRLRRFDEAMDVAKPLLAQENPSTEVRLLLGRLFAHKQNYERAFPYYTSVLEDTPRSIETRLELVNLYLATNQIEQAVEQYTALAEIDPVREAEYRFQAATRLMALQQYEPALTQFKLLAEMMDDFGDIYVRIGDLHGLLRQPEEAIVAYLTAIEKTERPQDVVPIRQRLALLYQDRGSQQEAAHQYKKIKEIDPDNVVAAQFLANHYLRNGGNEAALVEIDRLLELRPTDFRLHKTRSDVLITMGREVEAYRDLIHAFRQVLSSGSVPESNLFLADLASRSTLQRLEALALLPRFQQTLHDAALNPLSNRVLYAKAAVELFTENNTALRKSLSGLIEQLSTAVAVDDAETVQRLCAEWQMWYRVRVATIDLGLSDSLAETLGHAIRSYPEQPLVARTLGMVYMDRNEWSNASVVLNGALESTTRQHPLYRDLHFQLATVQEKLGRISEVESLMRNLIEINPRDAGALNFLGYTFADHDMNLEEALDLIQQALQVEPDDGNIVDSLGWVYFRMGRNRDALRELERALKLQGDHPVILEHLGDVYKHVGRTDKAKTFWKRAKQSGEEFPFEYSPEMRRRIQQKLNP